MIETAFFSLSPQEYYKIILRFELKKRGYLYVIILLLAIALTMLNIKRGEWKTLDVFAMVVMLGYPIFLAFYYYRWTRSAKNNNIYSERKMIFAADKIVIEQSNGLKSEISYSSFVKLFYIREAWLLYLNLGAFLYIPANAFKSVEDVTTFKTILKRIEEESKIR